MRMQATVAVAAQRAVQDGMQPGARAAVVGQRQPARRFRRQAQPGAQQRLHQETQAHRRGQRIARQADEHGAFAQARGQHRLARTQRHAMEQRLGAARLQRGRHEVVAPFRHRARAEHQVRAFSQRGVHCGLEDRDLVADAPYEDRLRTCRGECGTQIGRGRIVDAARRQRRTCRHDLATGRKHGHAWTPRHRDPVDTQPGDQHQRGRIQHMAGRQHALPGLHVFAAATDVRAHHHVSLHAYARSARRGGRQGLYPLHRHHRVGARRQRCSGHDLPGGRVVLRRGLSGGDARADLPHLRRGIRPSGRDQRNAIQRRVVERGQRHRADHLAGQHATDGIARGTGLHAQPVRAATQPLHRLPVTDHPAPSPTTPGPA